MCSVLFEKSIYGQNVLQNRKKLNKYNTEKRGINRYEYSDIQTGERRKST